MKKKEKTKKMNRSIVASLKQMNYRKRIKQLLLIAFSFVLIYAPPVIANINTVLILGFISMPYALIFRRSELVKLIKNIKEEMILYIAAYIYIFIMIGLHYLKNGMLIYDIKNIYRFVILLPVFASLAFVFIDMFKKVGFSKKDIFESMLIAANIQGLIGLAMLLSPHIKRMVVDVLIQLTGDTVYLQQWQYDRRFYGYSNLLLDTFGLGQALLLSLATLMGTYYNKKYFLYIPLILISAFLNSRTGLILYIVFVGLIFFMNLKRIFMFIKSIEYKKYLSYLKKENISKLREFKNIIKLLVLISAIIGVIVVGILGFGKFQSAMGKTVGWVNDGFISIYQLMTHQQPGDSLGKLFHYSWWQLPKGDSVLFGTGHTLYEYKETAHSDVGYINDIWLMGIVGVTLLYSAFVVMSLRFYDIEKNKINISMTIMLISFFILFNIKGVMLAFSSGTAVMYMLYFATILYSKKYEETVGLKAKDKLKENETKKVEIVK